MVTPLRSLVATLSVALLCSTAAFAQADKKPLTIDDYAAWRSVGSVSISEHGDWVTFGYSQREEDDVLHVKSLASDKSYEIERGSGPKLSDDSKWVAYFLSVPVAEAEKLKKEKKPVPRKVELLNLEDGKKIVWDDVTSFSFSKGSKFLAVKKSKSDKDAKHDGTNLILRYLDKGYEELLGSVASFELNKPGTVLAYTVDAVDKNGNGLYAIHLETGERRPLANDKARFSRLTWDEDGTALAVLKGDEKKGFEERENVLLAFRDVASGEPKPAELTPKEAYGFPKDMVISEKADLSFNLEATKVFFGLKKQYAEPDKKGKDGEKAAEEDKVANVDIWHWEDERIQSVQMVRAGRDRNRTDRGVFNLLAEGLDVAATAKANDAVALPASHVADDAETEPAGPIRPFVRLTDDEMRSIDLTRDGRWGIGSDDRAYLSDWRQTKADYYRVDTNTGERKLMLEGHGRTLGLSPDSEHFLYWKDAHVWDYVIDSAETRNLTEGSPTSFVNEKFDRPGELPPHGVAGWTEDRNAVILNSEYDLWLQPLDGSPAQNLTGGRGTEDEIRFRYVQTDPEERFIDVDEPLLLSAYGQWTKKSGYFRLGGDELDPRIFEDKRFGRRLLKAKEADVYLYSIESFEESPDYYVSDGSFVNPKRITDANPQQLEYRWGRRILFDFENSDGVRLQGTLGIPHGYRSGQKLPMLVNFYEKNSQNLHRYPAPRYASSPQFAGYVSNGYLAMQPDIHFRTGRSHSDMLECVEAAVKKVIELGYADPDLVGLHGHSYSGQGAAYIATHSDMFAAIVAGAAATNLVSDFNQLWKSAGTNQHRYDIYGQGRFGTNPFDDPELYRDQSAVHNARNMNTPLLLLHGTDDGAVEWLQAVEFYNALRFNDKEVILLSYPGEGHGLRKHENQKDFQVRMREFLDHHLKGAPAPEWMTRGRTFLEKERALKANGGGKGD